MVRNLDPSWLRRVTVFHTQNSIKKTSPSLDAKNVMSMCIFVVSSNCEPGPWDLWKMVYIFFWPSFYGISNTFITASCYTVVIISIYENYWLKSCPQTRCVLSFTKVFWSKLKWIDFIVILKGLAALGSDIFARISSSLKHTWFGFPWHSTFDMLTSLRLTPGMYYI